MHDRIRDVFLGSWGRLVATRPRPVLACALLVAAASVALTVTTLEFKSDRSDLVDPNLNWNRLYAEYRDRFEHWDDVTVCIEGDANDERIDALARSVALDLRRSEFVADATSGFEVTEIGPRLFAAAPRPQFDDVLGGIARGRRIAAAANANAALAISLGDLSGEGAAEGSLEQLEAALEPYLVGLAGGVPDFSALRPDRERWLPFVSEEGSGRIRFIQVHFREGAGVDRVSEDLRRLRADVAAAIGRCGLTGLTWGVTGIPAIEADETAQSIKDSTIASILAFLLITGLMLAVFRGVVAPLLAAASLMIGMAWSFGWLVLVVGHLQLLSIVFSVILLGLGIDFALHLVARLELVQDEHDDLPSATSRVFRGIGPGMLTGAITTMAAFGSTALTQFKGMAEMGIIAGGGIMLCLVAMLSCFPAMLALTGRWKRIIRHRPGGETAHFANGRLDTVDFHPRAALAAAAAVVVLLALPALRVRYDPNVLNLQPPGIESVVWEQRIVADDARSVWSGLLETSAEKAPRLVDELSALPQVSGVGAMGLLLPLDRVDRAERIAAVRALPVDAPVVDPGPGLLRTQLAAVRLGVLGRARAAGGPERAALEGVAARIGEALTASAVLSPEVAGARWSSLDAAFVEAAGDLGAWIEEALAPRFPGPMDLPPVLRRQWTVGSVWLLRIYPVADPAGRSILHPDRLSDFVAAVRRVDQDVLGPPVQIYESSVLIKREYIKASAYAIAAILFILLLDFRSLADTLCAMIPVSIGFIGTFGLMGAFRIPLNFANIIVMPLIFGIGVDAGVHMVHRWRDEPFGRPAGLSGGTGRGITLTLITTMIGFGCMVIAQHRGIRSLGFVMLAGLGVSLLACYFVLPAILRLRTAHWSTGPPSRGR